FRQTPTPPPLPSPALFRSGYDADAGFGIGIDGSRACDGIQSAEGFKGSMWFDSASHGATGIQVLYDHVVNGEPMPTEPIMMPAIDRKSTRLNSSHVKISYA